MADERIVRFLEGVLSKTKAGRVPWEPTAQEATFIAAIGGQFTLSVCDWAARAQYTPRTRSVSGSGPQYVLVLRDQMGRELATVTEAEEGITPGALRELYDRARRQALRPGEKIDNALEVLKSL